MQRQAARRHEENTEIDWKLFHIEMLKQQQMIEHVFLFFLLIFLVIVFISYLRVCVLFLCCLKGQPTGQQLHVILLSVSRSAEKTLYDN